jgi:hypothetical protein
MAKLYCSLNTYTMSIIIKNLHSYWKNVCMSVKP